MDVTIGVGTFGSEYWEQKGWETAKATSAMLGCGVIHFHHKDNLCDSRNAILSMVHTRYVIFLDADDELDSRYVEAMSKGIADIRVPFVRYRRNGVLSQPHQPRVPSCSHDGLCGPGCLPLGNYAVIGSAARTEALRALDGFKDWPMYEDWDLWLRAMQAGHTFENIPEAHYIANYSATSRNRAPTQEEKTAAHRAIATANGVL